MITSGLFGAPRHRRFVTFDNSKVMENQTSLSETLRQKRLLLDLTEAEVKAKTGVNASFIRSLENGNYYELPAEVYVQGYLKSLCRLYSLEYAKVLSLYKEETSWMANNQDLAKLPPQASSNFVLTSKGVLATGSLLIFLLIVSYFGWQIARVTGAPQLSLEAPVEGLQTEEGSLSVRGKTEAGAQVSINNHPILVGNNGQFNQTVQLNLGENQIIITAMNRFNRKTQIARRVIVGLPQVLGETDVKNDQ